MYNASGTAMGSTGVATLAVTGPQDHLFALTALALALIAIGGVLLLMASRRSKKKVDNEVG